MGLTPAKKLVAQDKEKEAAVKKKTKAQVKTEALAVARALDMSDDEALALGIDLEPDQDADNQEGGLELKDVADDAIDLNPDDDTETEDLEEITLADIDQEPITNSTNIPMDPATALGLAELYESGTLKELAEWWEARQGKDGRATKRKPKIQGKHGKQNSSICVDKELLKRALRKAERNKDATGGSVSSLMELLLWEYLGKPEDLLASNVQDKPQK